MPEPRVAQYGSWKSPITTDLIVSDTKVFGRIVLDGSDTYWAELRPSEGGRTVIVQYAADRQLTDLTPAPFNVRTRVHEYGGGAYTVAEGSLYFSNLDDQRLYRQDPGALPLPLTPEGAWRYADPVFDRDRKRVVCIREDHSRHTAEPINEIVSIGADGTGRPEVLATGNDFYVSPRLSPDGNHLAWLTWNHPHMPWDRSELWVATLTAEGVLKEPAKIAGGSGESIAQVDWAPDGTLYFTSDRKGWWNIHRWRNERVAAVLEMDAEFGRPHWLFGTSSFGFESAATLVCAYVRKGTTRFGRLHVEDGRLEPLEMAFSEMGRSDFKVAQDRAVFGAGSPTKPMSIVEVKLDSHEVNVLRVASEIDVAPGFLSIPDAIEFPTSGGQLAHAFYYRPTNADFVAPPEEKPPLMVSVHGGPTDATTAALNLTTQFWTSRGFAVLDVNYGGSVGYGRAYRDRLNGQWGVVDVEDCVNGARYLVERGEVHADRLAIRGGSAGGYTTLAALTFHDFFSAGASYYGVSDLETLLNDMPKFDAHSLDSLIGRYPEQRHLYVERSPIHHLDRLSSPVIFFHGLEDRVVPPNQTELIHDALRKKGSPTAYLAFPGEQHGFRTAASIKKALEAELHFYAQVFGFALAEQVAPLVIDNLWD